MLKHLLENIRNIGVHPHLSDEESSVVKMVNDGLIIAIIFTILDTIISLLTGKIDTALFTMMFPVLFMLSMVLHHYGKYYLAKVFLITILGVLLVIQSYFFGDTVDITNLFIVLIVFVIVVFEKDFLSIIIFTLYILLAFFLKNWIVKNLDHPLANEGMIYAKEVYFILSLILTSILILRVLKRKQRYIDLSNSLLTDLEKNNSALKESNDRLKSFAYATSHDLKTPLRNVASYIELLSRRISNLDDQKIQDYLSLTKKGVGIMNESIDDILTLSSLEYNSERWVILDLEEIIDELKFNYQVKLESDSLEIRTKALPKILGNRAQLIVLFQNLIDNSIKYNENSKVIIQMYGEKRSTDTLILFKDNGIGIEQEYDTYIFEPFKRLHSNSKYDGTGLGLAIVKKIMDSHSGSIKLQNNKQNFGTLFELRFPKLNNDKG